VGKNIPTSAGDKVQFRGKEGSHELEAPYEVVLLARKPADPGGAGEPAEENP
jgi:hypothetical protein